MIEAVDIDPRSCPVARFASLRRTIGFRRCHTILKFSLVWIGVAGGTRAVLKMKWQNFVCSSAESRFMAFGAGDCHVRSGQHEMGFLVFGDSERRTVKILYGVAIFATVQVRSCRELLVMFILVAVRACSEFHLVLRILARRDMALVAGNGRMLAFERIFRCRVLLYSE